MDVKKEFARLCTDFMLAHQYRLDTFNSTKVQPYFYTFDTTNNLYKYILFDLDKNGMNYDISFCVSPYAIIKGFFGNHLEADSLFSFLDNKRHDLKTRRSYANLLKISETDTVGNVPDIFSYFSTAFEACEDALFIDLLSDIRKNYPDYPRGLNHMEKLWSSFITMSQVEREETSIQWNFYTDNFHFFNNLTSKQVATKIETYNSGLYTKTFEKKMHGEFNFMKQFILYAIPSIYEEFDLFKYDHNNYDRYDWAYLEKFQRLAASFCIQKRIMYH